MTDFQGKWLFIGIVFVVLILLELIFGWFLGHLIDPIAKAARRWPRKIQLALLATLFIAALGIWFYGCSRPGF